jgi:hypothetical protein
MPHAPGGVPPGGLEPKKARTMDGDPTLDALMQDPADRRRWLLNKALETASLAEALALAQAAEDFISGTVQETVHHAPKDFEPKPGVAGRMPLQTVVTPEVVSESAEVIEGLSSLASIEDVVRYLKQCGEDAAETDNADELLARANRKRMSQGLPSFALLPPAPAAQPAKPDREKKVAPPRPPTARERAEWARRAVTLPAA